MEVLAKTGSLQGQITWLDLLPQRAATNGVCTISFWLCSRTGGLAYCRIPLVRFESRLYKDIYQNN
ncbi:hypothetical protein ACLK17_19610 [Escherichia coli]